MKRLFILSPSDRFNYGDMLFPYVVTHYFKKYVDEIVNCSTCSSDLSAKGGIPTYGIDKIVNVVKEDGVDNYLIVAGGECLFSRWSVILSFIYKDIDRKMNFISSLPHLRVIKYLANVCMTYYIRKKYKVPTFYPFTIGLDEIPGFKNILYNSVGSVSLINNPKIIRSQRCKKILKSAAYLSVRDSLTSSALDKMGVKHVLCPDSAILMSEVFSDNFLEKSVSDEVKNIKNMNYIFFQINKLSGEDRERFYSDILNRIYLSTGTKIILCPIGTAYGHEDDIILSNISKYMNNGSFLLIKSPSIWEIMYLIKYSKLYVGTSLHGAITAYSFSIPIVTHGKKKVRQYISEWGGCFSDPQQIEEDIIKQLTAPVVSSSSKQKQLVLSSFATMVDILKK